ncbi:PAS domain-containing protein [Polaribacter glomeratus]|uniref:PAS domain-containing protein n=1 Tax=Polaribacter glomeratus TaxID=102 RepID=A0A2S7WX67_9FLAO|nr:PAS domain-containing protein [Polaribacter glomeratus]PQJ82189.1 hypothetical protein BTO16_06195 [Polaribacter glomeratus]TXD66783.1 PAS domain S-box protein [Polaribacter glomeratus]
MKYLPKKLSSANIFTLFPNKFLANFIITVSTLLSLSVIFLWYIESEKALTLLTGTATMKFNTALVFLFAGVNLFIINKKKPVLNSIYNTLSFLIILIGLLTLVEYTNFSYFEIDNYFIKDVFSETNPGRMSPATAICSVLLGVGFLGSKSKNMVFLRFSQNTALVVFIISLTALIAYILIIPTENKIYIFKTMSLQTAILFFGISLDLILKRKISLFHKLFSSRYLGSEIFKRTLPLIIIFPVVIANLLLLGISENWISIDFSILLFTVIMIPLGLLYISRIAMKLNNTEKNRHRLENNLVQQNKKLKSYEQALNKTAIFSITDINGNMMYANNSFCEISNFSKEELIGNSHPYLNARYQENNLFKKIWNTINSGEIWKGEIKNKSKKGKVYTVNTTIIPVKDANGTIKEFIEINNSLVYNAEKN